MGNKVLLLSTRTFWPTNSGKDITLYYNCKGLAQTYGYEVYVYCFTKTSEPSNEKVPSFLKQVKYATRTNKGEVLKNIVVHSLYKQDWSLQSALYYGAQQAKDIQEYYEEIQPDVLIFDMIRLLPYNNIAQQHTGKKILFMDDLLSKRYGLQLVSPENKGSIYGQLANKLPTLLTRVSKLPCVRKALLKQEMKLVKKEEEASLDYFDYVSFVSPLEQQEFNREYNTQKGKVLSMGVDYGYYAEAMDVEKEAGTLSFVGNFHTAANYDSIVYSIERILPYLPAGTILKAIGSYPAILANTYRTHAGVQFLGRVEDLRSEVLKTQLCLLPIVYGTGIKTKIIEAMAMGMAVVTNPIGAEGIFAKQGRDWIVEESEEELIAAVHTLLKDSKQAKMMGMHGQRYVEEHHQWEKIYQAFDEMGLTRYAIPHGDI